LVLHYLADLSVEQIAADLGLPPGTVKARLVAARRRLERELTERPEAVRDARSPLKILLVLVGVAVYRPVL